MSEPRATRRARSTVHRLTIPGFAVLALIVTLGLGRASTRVDPHIVALTLVTFIALLVLGILIPVLTTFSVRVAASSPADTVVGDQVPITVTLTGRADRVTVRVLDPASAWFHTAVPAEGTILHLADQRGVFPGVAVEIRSSWPLGLYASGRAHHVALPRLVHVAPRPARVRATPGPLPADVTEVVHRSTLAAAGDSVRTVRPYQQGDPPRLVHWPSTARMGSLIVRELEPPVRTGLAIVVDLRPPLTHPHGSAESKAAVEAAAEHAAGLVSSALRSGAEVLLSTFDLDGPRIESISTIGEAGHQLARAVAGPPPPAPPGWPVEEVRP